MVYDGDQSEALPIEIAYGLNNIGQIVGSSNIPPPAPHVMESTAAQLYQDGTVTNLGSLGGYISAAFGINDRGEIVGYSDTGPDTTSPLHAFLYRDGKMTDLGVVGSDVSSSGSAINDYHEVVGFTSTGTNTTPGTMFAMVRH